MPKIKAKVDKTTYETLPPELRSIYVESQDGYMADVEEVDGWRLDNPRELRSALDRERQEREAEKKRLQAQWEGIGDPVKAREALARVEALEKAGDDPDGKIAARIKGVETTWEQRVKEVEARGNERINRLNSALDRRVRRDEMRAALVRQKATAEGVDLLTDRAMQYLRAEEKGDDWVSTVVTATGEPAYSQKPGKHSERMGIDELAETVLTMYPVLKQATEASGSGSRSQRGAAHSNGVADLEGLSPTQALTELRRAEARKT